MSRPVRTRFAPSPTGFLHIGGARTALFNRYFADHMGGEMSLRIEDTDQKRSTPEATQAIIDGLDWLGVRHDGEIIFQSQNQDTHIAAAERLIAKGFAYRDYTSIEATENRKEEFKKNHMDSQTGMDVPGYFSTDRFTLNSHENSNLPFVVRFKMPNSKIEDWDSFENKLGDGSGDWISPNDAVKTGYGFHRNTIDDFVLLRSDGTPTYMLAVVVDDHNAEITHVIRGDDHFSNAAKQQLLYQALDWEIPVWAHVPLIHGPDGKKLSKRHGALGAEAYRDMGYLPSGLRNYLVKLGWAHGDEEIFLYDEEISDVFTLDGINSAPARLDFDKMDYINAQHIAEIDADSLLTFAQPFLETEAGGPLEDDVAARIKTALPTLRPRSKTLAELASNARYLFDARPLEITGKTAKSLRRDGTANLVSALTSRLESLEDASWTTETLQSTLTDFVADQEIGFGKIGAPVRAALTAGAPSPDLHEVLAFLGRTETLARIKDAIPLMG